MWVFVSAGVLYLLGIMVVLLIKPTIMFTPDGQWKEFGIGQDHERFSPFPFWLFCLLWGVLSYTIVVILTYLFGTVSTKTSTRLQVAEENIGKSLRNRFTNSIQELNAVDLSEGTDGLPNGYYVLNKKATRLSGVPKYVFVGAKPPSD